MEHRVGSLRQVILLSRGAGRKRRSLSSPDTVGRSFLSYCVLTSGRVSALITARASTHISNVGSRRLGLYFGYTRIGDRKRASRDRGSPSVSKNRQQALYRSSACDGFDWPRHVGHGCNRRQDLVATLFNPVASGTILLADVSGPALSQPLDSMEVTTGLFPSDPPLTIDPCDSVDLFLSPSAYRRRRAVFSFHFCRCVLSQESSAQAGP